MNKTRNTKRMTKAEKKHRNRLGEEIETAFRSFTGFYKNNEKGS